MHDDRLPGRAVHEQEPLEDVADGVLLQDLAYPTAAHVPCRTSSKKGPLIVGRGIYEAAVREDSDGAVYRDTVRVGRLAGPGGSWPKREESAE